LKAVYALQAKRRGLIRLQNMPFLLIEDALLDARRASSAMLFVIS
jgi:hypothetical protein